MKRFKSIFLLVAVCSFALAACKKHCDDHCVITKHGIRLTGAQEVPPKETDASGTADVSFDKCSNVLKFTISDNLSGIKSYDGYLNGKWILLEYESKTKKLTHCFSDGIVDEGKNDLKVVVTDNVGNSTIFETQFFRSQKP